MDDERDRACRAIDIDEDLLDQRSNDPLFESNIRRRIIPDRLEVGCQRAEGFGRRRGNLPAAGLLFLEPLLQCADVGHRGVPSLLQFIGHQTILRVHGVVLLPGPLRRVACGLEVQLEGV
jgi:hypothetical protein